MPLCLVQALFEMVNLASKRHVGCFQSLLATLELQEQAKLGEKYSPQHLLAEVAGWLEVAHRLEWS